MEEIEKKRIYYRILLALFANRVVIGNRPGTTPITIDVSRQSQSVHIDMLESPTG